MLRTREHRPVVMEARRVPVATRIVVPTSGVVSHEPRHVRRKLAAALVVECGGAAVALVLPCAVLHDAVITTEGVVLPRVAGDGAVGDGVSALIEPVRHGRQLLRNAVLARARHGVRPAHGGHEIAHDAVEQRAVPICRGLRGRAVGRRELRHNHLRVRVPCANVDDASAEEGWGGVGGR